MVSAAEIVIAGLQELGEFNGIDDVEVEPQIDGPKDLEVEMDEPQVKHEEQENEEEPQGWFMFGDVP